jgi:hypothetical protein
MLVDFWVRHSPSVWASEYNTVPGVGVASRVRRAVVSTAEARSACVARDVVVAESDL